MINLKTENNKDIFIYDNVFESHNVQKYYYYIINSFFKLNGKDGDVLEQQDKYSVGISSNYDKNDVADFKFLDNLPEDIKTKFNINFNTID